MKRSVFSAPCIILFGLFVGGAFEASAQSGEKKKVHVALTRDTESDPTTKFSPDAPKIYAFWKAEGLRAGDKLRAVWIAENVGYDGLKESTITEASIIVYKSDDDGVFSLARPAGGWPVGKYRFELYVWERLAEAVKFTVQSDTNAELR